MGQVVQVSFTEQKTHYVITAKRRVNESLIIVLRRQFNSNLYIRFFLFSKMFSSIRKWYILQVELFSPVNYETIKLHKTMKGHTESLVLIQGVKWGIQSHGSWILHLGFFVTFDHWLVKGAVDTELCPESFPHNVCETKSGQDRQNYKYLNSSPNQNSVLNESSYKITVNIAKNS